MNGLRLVLLCVLLSGCSPSTMIERFADDAKEKIAREYIQCLIEGQTATLVAELDPSLHSGEALQQIRKMRAAFPAGSPTVTNLVGYQSSRTPEGMRYNLTYQFGYGDQWVLSNVAWRELADGKRLIVGMSARRLDESLRETHALSFRRATARHYLFAGAAIAVPSFIVVTLVTCVRMKLARRKWLWVIFILLGFVSFSMNWTTGQMGVTPVSFLLFGASATAASIYSPWTVSIAIPVGAIIFWVRRKRLRVRATGQPQANAPS